MSQRKVAMAIAAHPDDIEFYMAGTLVLLGRAGYELHYMNLASGNCGSLEMTSQTTALIRGSEAKRAAGLLGATWHGPIASDLEIVYDVALLRRLVGVVRRVDPTIVLTHSPDDYMEDHENACRLAVTAAFAKGIPNFRSEPPSPPASSEVTVYHAMPHGLRDPLRRRVRAGIHVDTTTAHETKLAALAAHASQKEWLDRTQGMDSYLQTMEAFSRRLGEECGFAEHAEGWRRHLHFGFSTRETDPLVDHLAPLARVDPQFEAGLG